MNIHRLSSEESRADEQKRLEPPSDWPHYGTIEFRDYSLRYRSDIEPALKNININVCSNEKLGIIGRTGTFYPFSWKYILLAKT